MKKGPKPLSETVLGAHSSLSIDGVAGLYRKWSFQNVRESPSQHRFGGSVGHAIAAPLQMDSQAGCKLSGGACAISSERVEECRNGIWRRGRRRCCGRGRLEDIDDELKWISPTVTCFAWVDSSW